MDEITTPFTGKSNDTPEQSFTKCISFLNSIGIKTIAGKVDAGSFLPGLSIQAGSIVYDVETLSHPGDILHEAGHIAVVPAADRASLDAASISKRKDRDAEEMMAIAWSYAACIHLDLDPYFVFHDDGYKQGGRHIADNFNRKRYFGLPMLQWVGLTADEKNAAKLSLEPYPNMIKWLRD